MNVTRWKDQSWLTVPSAYYKIKVISKDHSICKQYLQKEWTFLVLVVLILQVNGNICTEHSHTNRTSVIEIQSTIIKATYRWQPFCDFFYKIMFRIVASSNAGY